MGNGKSSRNRLRLAEVSACKAKPEAILGKEYDDFAMSILILIGERDQFSID